MKKLPLILSALSLAGVVALFIISFSSKTETVSSPKAERISNGECDLSIAYINTDSVLINYQLAVDLNNEFIRTQSQFNEEYSRKLRAFERDAVSFQEKIQRGGFLTEDRAIRERDRLVGEEQEIQRLDVELSTKLGELEQRIHIQLIDSIVNYVQLFNNTHQYSYIFSNSGNIIIGDQQSNISKDILEGLNARYTASKRR